MKEQKWAWMSAATPIRKHISIGNGLKLEIFIRGHKTVAGQKRPPMKLDPATLRASLNCGWITKLFQSENIRGAFTVLQNAILTAAEATAHAWKAKPWLNKDCCLRRRNFTQHYWQRRWRERHTSRIVAGGIRAQELPLSCFRS